MPFKPFQIPLRKKRNGLAGRHGEGVEKARVARNVNVNESAIGTHIEREIITIDSPHVVNDEIFIVSDEESSEKVIVSSVTLPKSEVESVNNNEMLSDIVIDAAQKILRAQFKANGFQDTVLGQKLLFREEKEPFAQVLHNGSYHWVLVSN